ncbi:MAG: GlsB/YeaQ/YmgE family stress response membrane protein [Gemmatimonadetes bacterium]|nr:GlsB/YeaQ/YmgE family stress response membrane protein [Gemmatimonadota bacterium]
MLYTIIIGFLAGLVAKMLYPGKQGGGIIVTILLGIAGSWVGSFLSGMLGMGRSVGFIGSVIGAMIVLWLYNKLNKSA